LVVEKRANLFLITIAEILALALWFSGTAAGPGLLAEATAPVAGFQAWLTSAVQAGFVLGTFAALALPDRFDPRRVFSASALLGAAANAIILILPPGSLADLACRFATGIALAGIYPVGMKLAVGWSSRHDTGLVVGLLVGGLTLGSALPHLVNALGGLGWRPTIAAASLSAAAAAILILRTSLGPLHATAPRFRPSQALLLLRDRGTRLATLGYLGHMWELYAMWAWIGAYLGASFAARDAAQNATASPAPALASLATFAVIGAGAIGSVGAGLLADRIGRVRVTCAAMLVSAICCLLAGPLFGAPAAVTIALGLIWGVAVVADSAQFSACIAELAPPGLTGTLLTVQVCLGFSLTLIAIQLMPWFIALAGWGGAFAVLALGPLLGIWAMLTLQRSPDAARLAGGRG
jgi:MFS family permease